MKCLLEEERMRLKLALCKEVEKFILVEDESKRKKKCRATAANTNEITLGEEEKE